MGDANWISIVVAALSTMLVGFLLYNPKVIGKSLSEAMNVSGAEPKKAHQPWIYVVSILLAGVIAYKLSGGASHHPEEDRHFLHGAFHGLLTALYIVAPVMITNLLFESRPLKVIALHVGYWLACFALMGGIVYAVAGAGY